MTSVICSVSALALIHSLVFRYMKKQHLIDVTEIFRVIGAQKKYRLVKLGLLSILFLFIVFRYGVIAYKKSHVPSKLLLIRSVRHCCSIVAHHFGSRSSHQCLCVVVIERYTALANKYLFALWLRCLTSGHLRVYSSKYGELDIRSSILEF